MTPKSDIYTYVFVYHIWAAIRTRVRGIISYAIEVRLQKCTLHLHTGGGLMQDPMQGAFTLHGGGGSEAYDRNLA